MFINNNIWWSGRRNVQGPTLIKDLHSKTSLKCTYYLVRKSIKLNEKVNVFTDKETNMPRIANQNRISLFWVSKEVKKV